MQFSRFSDDNSIFWVQFQASLAQNSDLYLAQERVKMSPLSGFAPVCAKTNENFTCFCTRIPQTGKHGEALGMTMGRKLRAMVFLLKARRSFIFRMSWSASSIVNPQRPATSRSLCSRAGPKSKTSLRRVSRGLQVSREEVSKKPGTDNVIFETFSRVFGPLWDSFQAFRGGFQDWRAQETPDHLKNND